MIFTVDWKNGGSMLTKVASILVTTCALSLAGDWSPKAAADYLDARQKAWFAWPTAQKGPEGPCLSCHTGLTYLLARPALGQALGENEPTSYESGMLQAIRKRVPQDTSEKFAPRSKEPKASESLGSEAVMSALLLASDDARHGGLTKETEQAFDRLWAVQLTSGKNKGAWSWNSFDLDPWEEPDSMFYGAALAALAVGVAPSGYQSRPNIQANVGALKAYLAAHQQSQPAHNRLLLVWASTKLRGIMTDTERKRIVTDVLHSQQPDGGWTIASIGPWKEHTNAPAASGSNSYATGLVAFVLQQAGIPRSNPSMNRALEWLRAHQDKDGSWDAQSMNKKYDAGSMPLEFMRDAATSFASLALLESNNSTR